MTNIIFYTTSCPICKLLKRKLDGKQINYKIEDSIEKMIEKGINHVPCLEVKGQILNTVDSLKFVEGFNE